MAAKLEQFKETIGLIKEKPAIRKFSGIFMVICCVLPIAAIIILPRMGVALSDGAWVAIVMLCPVSHFIMMRFMHGRSKKKMGCHSSGDQKA